MFIHKVAIGNKEEAFIHSSFSDQTVNIISSDDNNRGKTILIQSIMYCLGNTPIFPSSFNYQNYYYIIEFSVNNKRYILCRKKDTFILRQENSLMLLNNTSELKRYWNKNIFDLPIIKKNGIPRIVDPELFVQLFFVGQDKKDTSNIANKGFYKKEDFNNMIYAIEGLGAEQVSQEEISSIKMQLKELKSERALLLREHKILKSSEQSSHYLSAISDKAAFESQIKEVEEIKEAIAALRVARNAAVNRRLKCEITLKELKSLNRSMDHGELRCMDCDSTHIGFRMESKSKCTFDITTVEVRHEIIESIENKIVDYTETIEIITSEINSSQAQLQKLLANENITLESIVAYKQDIFNAAAAEKRILEIDDKIERLAAHLVAKGANALADKQTALRANIVETMNSAYQEIDPTGNLYFDDLFTTKDKIYSGSEATIFHLVKLLALAKVLKHEYPIIVDSFRAEDLSTSKEGRVIKLFDQLGTQIIFTTTLKREERGKYDSLKGVHHIDFTNHAPSKMLSSSYVAEFLAMTAQLALNVSDKGAVISRQ